MSASHIAIVPARRGSKTIKDKNLTELNGKNLVEIAIQKAINQKIFRRVIVTTDYNKRDINFDNIPKSTLTQLEFCKRPPELAEDNTPMIDVILHALSFARGDESYVWLLQPPCPFTSGEDFQSALKEISKPDVNSVVSLKPLKEHMNRCYTEKLFTPTDGTAAYYKAYPLKYTNYENKQDLKPIYIRSGNIYISRRDLILKNKSIENDGVASIDFDRIRGTNIDDQEDLVLAKYWLQRGMAHVI